MEKLLSIIIPTVNRCEYLKRTVEHLLPQVIRNLSQVEFIICSNASSDNTQVYVEHLQKEYDFVQYHYFDDFVPICDSFSRSIGTATGKYVILWGDDDLPAPFVVDFILEQLMSDESIGLLHYNVVIGRDMEYDIDINRVENSLYQVAYVKYPLKDFLVLHSVTCGFITSLVFLRDAWYKGLSLRKNTHYGFDFLYVIFHGVKDKLCIYCNYPMAIQRMPFHREWTSSWPLYGLIGMPNLLQDLEKDGLTSGALQYWERKYNSFNAYLSCLLFAAQSKKDYKTRCSEITRYQTTVFRKLLAYFIIYLFPSRLVHLLRKIVH